MQNAKVQMLKNVSGANLILSCRSSLLA